MFKKMFLLVCIVLLCAGCPGGSSNGGSEEAREFYIEDYKIFSTWQTCWRLDSGSASEEVSEPEPLEAPIKERKNILYPYHSYSLFITSHYNDHDNTKWVAFEIFVDGERFSSAGAPFIEDTKSTILLFNRVPWSLVGKEVVVDVWLEDADGVKSEVFTFDVMVVDRWVFTN